MSEEEKNNKFENITLDDAKKTIQNIFNDITPKEFEEIKKQAIENVKSKENKDIIFINGKPIIINFNDNKPDDKPIIDANHTLLKMNDNWYIVDKVFYDYVDKYQQAIYKIKEYITGYESISTIQGLDKIEQNKTLDEHTINVMTNRYLEVHDKILELLEEIE